MHRTKQGYREGPGIQGICIEKTHPSSDDVIRIECGLGRFVEGESGKQVFADGNLIAFFLVVVATRIERRRKIGRAF